MTKISLSLIALGAVGCALMGCEKNTSSASKDQQSNEVTTKRSDRVPRTPTLGNLNESDVRSAIIRARRNSNYSAELTSQLTELAKRDPQAAMDLFTDETILGDWVGFPDVVFEVGRNHPELIAVWLQDHFHKCSKEGNSSSIYAQMAFGALASKDPQKAAELFGRMELDPTERSSALVSLFHSYGNQDISGAVSTALSNLKGSEQQSALVSVFQGAAQDDPVGALQKASELQDGKTRNLAKSFIVSSMLEDRPDDALMLLQKMENNEVQSVLSSNRENAFKIISKFAEIDSQKLIAVIDNIIPTTENYDVFQMAVTSCATKNLQQTFNLINAIPEGDLKSELLKDAFESLSESNLASAFDQIGNLLDEKQRKLAVEAVGSSTGRLPLEEALQMGNSFDAKERAIFVSSAIKTAVFTDPKSVADLLTTNTTKLGLESKDRQSIFSDVGKRLADSDIDAAKAWLDRVDEQDKTSAYKGVAKSMVSNDVQGLAQMLANTPNRDKAWVEAAKILVNELKHTDVENSRIWQQEVEKISQK